MKGQKELALVHCADVGAEICLDPVSWKIRYPADMALLRVVETPRVALDDAAVLFGQLPGIGDLDTRFLKRSEKVLDELPVQRDRVLRHEEDVIRIREAGPHIPGARMVEVGLSDVENLGLGNSLCDPGIPVLLLSVDNQKMRGLHRLLREPQKKLPHFLLIRMIRRNDHINGRVGIHFHRTRSASLPVSGTIEFSIASCLAACPRPVVYSISSL